ncbi:MAG: hypothetical protein RMJ28_02990 [Nitrososphaerota archaeon]|nr:hypothetical protein [Candidatus Calditenuaceae archaeon]MDW8073186.1 hypothetical protein [Nitrososphaerota archaeon]
MVRVNTKWVAGVAVLAALAYALSLMKLHIRYPLLPFLSFDISEIPDVLAYLLFGFSGGLVAAFAHWIALNFGTPFHQLVGPTMKLLAVLTTIIGLEVASRIRGGLLILNSVSLAVLMRTSIMAAATFLLYYYLFPNVYLPFSRRVLGGIGISVESDLTLAAVMVVFTSIFNILHVFLTVIPAYAIYNRVVMSLPQLPTRRPVLRGQPS